MRGNWESAEALVLTPNQQLQQLPQQQSSMIEDHHPLHSPATPAWGITDRIVKGEPTDDKNNDSGVSPGHYTSSGSPRSRRSSSTANCSLSPGSVGSGDSQPMHVNNYDYSPQNLFKNCTSPLDFPRIPAMEDIAEQAELHQSMDIGTTNSGTDEPESAQNPMQCPVCQFTTQDRLQFTEHLTGHYTNRDTSDYSQPLFPQLSHLNTPQLSPMDDNNRASPPSGSERSEHDSEIIEEPGVRTPRVNSQGKVKTFRCKQCTFVAVTKLSFWDHLRGHIKVEKLLTCPRCPFVTEYKHHLEYHLRNHFNSKPFKCDKCPYTCVNKSMLNSHLKSHSNIYQYRCANCQYATKYCHSLKLHLRKYNHQPAMVLNADGSPNPLPIIDVYGTRRGPKQKPILPKPDETLGKSQSPQMIPQLGALTPLSMNNGINPLMFNPFHTIFSGIPVVNGFSGDDADKIEGFKANIFAEYARAIVADRLNADLPLESNYGSDQVDGRGINQEEVKGVGAPLDLSTHEIIGNNNNNNNEEEREIKGLERIDNSPRTNGKSRRKGKAVKLNRQIVEKESEDEKGGGGEGEREERRLNGGGAVRNEFICQYCEIAFGNEVMYSVHMGYHGYSDPFTCNMCGHKCADKVSFFLHIAKVKHA